MSDPYREATRHMRSRGMSKFAKVALLLGGFFVVAATVLVMAVVFVMKRLSDTVGDFRENPAATVANMVEELGADVSVVSTDEDAGKVVLRVGGAGELVTVDVSEFAEPVQEAGDPSVRFDGEADESGGIVRIETEAGKTTVELRGGEDGGFLDISTPDREMRFGAGSGSSALPEWVPVYPGAQVDKRLFSAETDEGSVGGAVLKSDATPQELFDWYRKALDGKTSTITTTSMRDGEMRARIEAVVRGSEHRELTAHIGEDDEGQSVIVIVYQTGYEGH